MCGRYTITVLLNELRERFGFETSLDSLVPRYNLAPTQDAPVIIAGDGNRVLQRMRWGLIPSWADDPKIGNRLINARSETAAEKPSFRAAFRRRRCLVPADGFYEWKKNPGASKKTPMRVIVGDGEPFAFAGLWETWKNPGGDPVATFTILTTTPNELLRTIHHRMPVILQRNAEEVWMDAEREDPEELTPLLKPYPSGEMRAYPVSTMVNSPANDTPACLEEAGEGA
jgi:putative SOS response-associated peptidase YedK